MTQPAGPLSRTVLIVDHDVAQLTRLRREFELSGYRTLSATSGDAALRLLDAASWPIGYILCSLVLPDMDGPALHAEVLDRGRARPFVFMADGNGEPAPPACSDPPPVLLRPFTIAQAEAAFRKAGHAPFRGV